MEKTKTKFLEIANTIVICSLLIVVFIFGFKIMFLEEENNKLNKTIEQKDKKIHNLEMSNIVKIGTLQERVGVMHKFLKKTYPGYDYQQKFDEAVLEMENENFNEKLGLMPLDLLTAYIDNTLISEHGASKYQLSIPEICWPLKEETLYNKSWENEYGTYRPYSYYNWKHEGIDLFNYTDDEVLAVYNGYINDVQYNEVDGWFVDLKFMIENEAGRLWCYSRVRHLDKIFVKKGETVIKGHILGSIGNTGIWSTGNHLHWELYIWDGSDFININPVQNSTWGVKYIEKVPKRKE